MKILFAGTPEFAVEPLKRLIKEGKEVVGVVTQQDRPFGRKGILTPPPVKVVAQENGIPVYQFPKIRNEVETLKNIGADVMFTCAYGQLLTQEVLDCFKGGVWNAHASLLPKYRGASPIQAAISCGETQTGVTIMKTELALDSGDMLLVKRLAIKEGETCGELTQRLSLLAADALSEAAELLEKGDCNLLLQDDSAATYCKKITKQDAAADFSLPCENVCAHINAMSPSPAAFCAYKGGNLNIYRAFKEPCEDDGKPCGYIKEVSPRGIVVKCGTGAVRITELQFAGGKRISAADAANGRKICAGDMLE